MCTPHLTHLLIYIDTRADAHRRFCAVSLTNGQEEPPLYPFQHHPLPLSSTSPPRKAYAVLWICNPHPPPPPASVPALQHGSVQTQVKILFGLKVERGEERKEQPFTRGTRLFHMITHKWHFTIPKAASPPPLSYNFRNINSSCFLLSAF